MYSEETVANALTPNVLELIILPTEKCNFRCTYCYEDFKIGRMSERTVGAIKKLLEHRIPKIKKLHFSWFGGEPLLAKDVCIELSKFAKHLCEINHVSFSGGFTTNGYLLTPELARQMFDLSQRNFQITLDGDEEWHNKTRVQPNRKPTFQRIWDNILMLKNMSDPFHVQLRLHVHADNIESVKRLYDRLNAEILIDKRFSVYFHRISDLNPREAVKENLLNDEDYEDALTYISGVDREINGHTKSEIHLNDYICYAAKPNSLLIRANGSLGKCTVALDDDRNSIGRILEDGTLEISNPKLQQWFLGYSDLSKDTLVCPLATLPPKITEKTISIKAI